MTDASRHHRAKGLFLRACEMASGDRGSFVNEACRHDDGLRKLVLAMLDADSSPSAALDGGAARVEIDRVLDEGTGSPGIGALPGRIGRYTVTGVLGEGGMGTVYKGEQENPRRRVAIKVIRPGLASGRAVQRFLLEAQALGRLQHPGIAQIFDAGVAPVDDGQAAREVPFFAMELVEGEPLDVWARSRRPGVRRCLEIACEVCETVHHAHQKGVVHRDLKPANILVVPDEPGEAGPPARVKVLDFGVARLTRAETGEVERLTLHTSPGQLVGTLPYMSPEQVGAAHEDVDARADIYALGVLLYELLAGRLPLGLEDLSLPDAARAIREHEPRRLSLDAPTLRGDVETIVAKAMAKDPAARYASAAALADDIRRHLRDEPIEARPPNTVYQLRKFARRHRAVVVGGGVAIGAILIALVVAVWTAVALAHSADRERDLRVAAELAGADARTEAVKFRAVVEFLQEMLASADPAEGPNAPGVTVRALLDETAAGLDAGALGDQPEVESAVRATVGNTYRALAEYDEAERQLERAVELCERAYPGGDPDLAWAINKLARLHEDRGRREAALALHRRALEMRLDLLGPHHLDTATSMNNIGYCLYLLGRYDRARPMYERSLEIRRRLLGDEHELVASSLNNLAVLALARGDYRRAEASFRGSLEIDTAVRQGDHPNIAVTMANLGNVLGRLGRHDEAREHQAEAAAMIRRLHGERHPLTAYCELQLATTLERMDEPASALPLLEHALAVNADLLGESHPRTARVVEVLASVHAALGDGERAETLARRAANTLDDAYGDEHSLTAGALGTLGEILMYRGRHEEALPLLERAVTGATAAIGPDHPSTALLRLNHGECLLALGEHKPAETTLLAAYGPLEAALGRSHALCTRTAAALGGLYEARGRPGEAARWEAAATP